MDGSEEKATERPRRQPYAAGDGLTRYPSGSAFSPMVPVVLRIDSPWEKPWKARLPGGAMAAPFPGTAIEFEGALYEVVRAEATGNGPPYIYLLAPWEEESPRQVIPYSVEACERAARERAERQRRIRIAHGLSWLSPVVGLLPADLQRSIEREYNVSAHRATLTSGLTLLGPSLYAVVRGVAMLMAQGQAGPRDFPWDLWLPLSSYLLLESLFRLGVVGYANDSLGELFVSLPILAFQVLRRVIAERRQTKPHPPGASSHHLLNEARDEVNALPEGRREILSLLPKPHWGSSTGVLADDRWHRLESREEVEREGGRWHRFVLAPTAEPEEEVSFRSRVEHRPEEVRDLHRQGLLFRKQTWVETFAPLWGLLDAATQRRLAELYGYDPPRHTAWSALGVAILAGAEGLLALRYLGARQGGPAALADLAMLLAAVYFVFESLARLQRARSGEPAGSVLGWVLVPFARRLVV